MVAYRRARSPSYSLCVRSPVLAYIPIYSGAGPRLLPQRKLELSAALGRLCRGGRQRHDAPWLGRRPCEPLVERRDATRHLCRGAARLLRVRVRVRGRVRVRRSLESATSLTRAGAAVGRCCRVSESPGIAKEWALLSGPGSPGRAGGPPERRVAACGLMGARVALTLQASVDSLAADALELDHDLRSTA